MEKFLEIKKRVEELKSNKSLLEIEDIIVPEFDLTHFHAQQYICLCGLAESLGI